MPVVESTKHLGHRHKAMAICTYRFVSMHEAEDKKTQDDNIELVKN